MDNTIILGSAGSFLLKKNGRLCQELPFVAKIVGITNG